MWHANMATLSIVFVLNFKMQNIRMIASSSPVESFNPTLPPTTGSDWPAVQRWERSLWFTLSLLSQLFLLLFMWAVERNTFSAFQERPSDNVHSIASPLSLCWLGFHSAWRLVIPDVVGQHVVQTGPSTDENWAGSGSIERSLSLKCPKMTFLQSRNTFDLVVRSSTSSKRKGC